MPKGSAKMTIDEWRAKQEDVEYVIKVMKNKTAGSFRPARAVVSFKVYDLMEEYFTHIEQRSCFNIRCIKTDSS